MRGQAGSAVRNHQPSPAVRNGPLLLMRVPPVHDQRRAIEPVPEEARIGLVLQPVGHVTVTVGNHAVARNDGVPFNRCALHACSPLDGLLHKPFGQAEGSSTLLPPGVAQERGIDIRYGEAEKRAMLKGSIGMLVAPVVISSAISAPTPGPSWKPWAEKPN